MEEKRLTGRWFVDGVRYMSSCTAQENILSQNPRLKRVEIRLLAGGPVGEIAYLNIGMDGSLSIMMMKVNEFEPEKLH